MRHSLALGRHEHKHRSPGPRGDIDTCTILRWRCYDTCRGSVSPGDTDAGGRFPRAGRRGRPDVGEAGGEECGYGGGRVMCGGCGVSYSTLRVVHP